MRYNLRVNLRQTQPKTVHHEPYVLFPQRRDLSEDPRSDETRWEFRIVTRMYQ